MAAANYERTRRQGMRGRVRWRSLKLNRGDFKIYPVKVRGWNGAGKKEGEASLDCCNYLSKAKAHREWGPSERRTLESRRR